MQSLFHSIGLVSGRFKHTLLKSLSHTHGKVFRKVNMQQQSEQHIQTIQIVLVLGFLP